jgi:type IV pilus assembly protein PilA
MRMVGIYGRSQKAFTLIELMIVIAIIGVLASIAIPIYRTYQANAFKATTRSDVKNAHTAVQAYIADHLTETVVSDSCVGPNQMTNYSSVTVSPGVFIVVQNNGDVTGSHSNLNGNYGIRKNSAVEDNLSE